jgi:hypothetical protein
MTEPYITAPPSTYLVGEHRYEITPEYAAPGFADVLASAHLATSAGMQDRTSLRPRCLCQPEGIEMYVARLGEGYIVKRMPGTGCQHAPDCPSYDPPPEYSGLGQVLGTAITENTATGQTLLRIDFSLSRIAGRAGISPTANLDAPRSSATSDGTRLSLRALLHYLWEQAGLTRWQPGFAGKRSWATVRRHLLQASEHKSVRGAPLSQRLYIPEGFWVDQREAINARRLAQWASAVPSDTPAAMPDKPQHLMLMIAEVKEIAPARYGHKAVIKHVPDQAFTLDTTLYRRLSRRFQAELALWGAADDLHMVMIATFGVGTTGLPAIAELSLMPVTAQWLPVEDAFDKQLIEALVRESRTFAKGLRYNLPCTQTLANATLLDCAGHAPLLFIAPPGVDPVSWREAAQKVAATADGPMWAWQPLAEAMPPLPGREIQLRGTPRTPVITPQTSASQS